MDFYTALTCRKCGELGCRQTKRITTVKQARSIDTSLSEVVNCGIEVLYKVHKEGTLPRGEGETLQ